MERSFGLLAVSWALGTCPVARAWMAVPGRFGGVAGGKQAAPPLCLQL